MLELYQSDDVLRFSLPTRTLKGKNDLLGLEVTGTVGFFESGAETWSTL
jgi:hypothetical protein